MQVWDVIALFLFALLLIEYWALLHWGLYRFGIPVWRQHWDTFPSGTPGTSINCGDDTYWMASEDLWLFQRKSLSFGALQYKGAIRRSADGAIVSVLAPFSPVALLITVPAAVTARGDAPGETWFVAVTALGLLLFAWARGRAAARKLESQGHA